ncbi:uncharacterized protein LOC126903126 isoform X2 [Daktulosphaira vitifoliae]|nr:uncharacterized protein LOC126903126 isoform X2 [Daktulosphaira vitifoliae]
MTSSSPSQKKFKSSSSDVLSVTSDRSISKSLAYGNRYESDDFDSDDSMMSILNISNEQSTVNIMPLETSNLTRENGVLFSEDLDECEIWTLQGDDIDMEDMIGKTIDFDNLTVLKSNNLLSHKIDVIPLRCQEETKITIIAPSNQTKQLSLNVIPLYGKLLLSSRVYLDKYTNFDLPIDTVEDAAQQRLELKSNIIKRLTNNYDFISPLVKFELPHIKTE